ncbi:MAG: methyltransferase family protein [Ignavibacteriales bacterium]
MAQQQKELQRGPLPLVYFLLAIAFMLALHFVLPLWKWLHWPWNLTGVVPITAGLVIILIADRQFKTPGTTVKPFHLSSRLVTDGMFRYTRNPMYLGMVIILLGMGICLASITPPIVVPVFIYIITVKFIRAEERSLEQQFGQAYTEYRSRVRQWI